jgi:SAM-dependent methyltransferase
MLSESEQLRHQSEEHPLVPTSEFRSLEDYVLYLIHRVAYEEAAKFAEQSVVLDLGCNNGYGTVIVANNSRLTIGVDVSPAAVESAQRYNLRENVQYKVIDGLRLPFEDSTFDLVVSFQVIEHISNVARYLSEIRRVLKPAAAAIFTTPNARIRLDEGMKPWNEFHVREYSESELCSVLKEWFPDVLIRGLFASQDLYDIELARVQRSKQNAVRRIAEQKALRYKAKRTLVNAIKVFMPRPLIDALRMRLGAHVTPATMTTGECGWRYSTADFYYRESDIDKALDFMAVCRTTSR